MLSFIVFRLHIKSNILKGKLTEITPGINYYLSTSLSKCFVQFFLTRCRILLDLRFSHALIQKLPRPLVMYLFCEEHHYNLIKLAHNSFVKVQSNKISLIYLPSVTLHLKSECSTGDATTYKRTARNNGHLPEKTIKLRNNMPTTF